ncbi:MAG: Unknown protein [uncultured Sulfurovum sp.]|uniref:Uncharacterized protein n=1 Tax=uncultured Sulfurovum sp. TaxID=269237 RepID=A0A6S6T4D5_9BACT|nr:MAG: Unknown protein [uncultured Sulfurovum sp.]
MIENRPYGGRMTDKEQFIHNLHQARINEVRWLGAVKLLSSDMPVKAYSFELNLVDIDFGKWFYAEASLITAINSIGIIDEMENILTSMHKKFMDIYQVCVLHRKKNFMGKTKALTLLEKNVMLSDYQEVVILSDKFQKILRRFERMMQAKPEDEFSMFAYVVKNEDLKEESKKEVVDKDNLSTAGARGAYFNGS